MPFDPTSPLAPEPETVGVGEYDKPSPAFLDTLSAAFRQENLIGSYLTSARRTVDDFEKVDPNYDVFDDIKGYEDNLDRFETVYNQNAAAAVKADIDKEKKDREILAASGWTGTGLTMGASILDPTIFLPGGALVKAGRLGYRAGRSALAVGVAAGAATAVQEGGLQATQELRTAGESAINIGGSAILGGIVGAAAAKYFSKAEWGRFGASLKADLTGEVVNPDEVVNVIVSRAQSAGAAAIDDIKLDDLGVGGPKVAQAVAKATAAARVNPGIQTMLSPSKAVRETYTKLVDNPIYSKMNMAGDTLGSDVENLVKLYQRGAMSQWLRSSRDGYREARKAGFKGTKSDFYEAVAFAGRRGDVDPNGNQFVTRAAQEARAKVFDPLLKRAQANGQLADDVGPETSQSYVTRMWNRTRLIAEEPRFREIAREYFLKELAKTQIKAEEINIGNRIVDADRIAGQFEQADERLEGLERRLAGRAAARQRKVADLEITRQTRMGVLQERAPKPLVDMLRGADENAAMVDAVKQAREAQRSANKKQSFAEAKPVLAVIRRKGGVRIGSQLDSELRSMGVTPKTNPGLFLNRGGIGDVDNFVKSEDKIFSDLPDDGAGYVDARSIYEAIRSELAGDPLRTADEIEAERFADNIGQVASEWLERVGLPENATVKDVRDFIGRVLGAEKDVDAVDAKVSRLEREIEDFDKATDSLKNEAAISGQEAATIRTQLDDLDGELEKVAELSNASPRVSIIVDYARTKRDLFKAKLKERHLTKRLDAIQELDSAGKANDDLLAELAAKSVDLKALDAEIKTLIAKADKLQPMVPRMRQKLPDFVSDIDRDDYINDVITAVFNNLTGKGKGDVPEWLVPVTRGPLKERTFKIPDDMVEEFLENDMELILRRYTRIMGAEVELASKFGRADMKEQFDAITKEYVELRKTAKSPAEREVLTAAEKRDTANLAAFRDMIRGTYRASEESSSWSAITRGALAWNYMRLLGGVTLSSLTDSARLVGVHGVRATMSQALPALVARTMAAKIAKGDARDLGVVAESVLQSRLASLADLNDPYASGAKFDRFLSNATNAFSKATGLSWWNDTMKTMASVMTQNRILKNAEAGDFSKIPERERAYMAFLGIDEDMAQRIASQFQAHGSQDGNIYGANVSQWDDELAVRAYGAALSKDVDRTIVTKGAADQPLWTKTNWGRLIMQFKSFGMASHQRVLIAGLQERPHRFAEQLVFATAVGMMISYLKMVERGDFERADDLISNPGKWVADGLDRSGIMFLAFEPVNTVDKVLSAWGGPNVGVNRVFSELAGDENTGGSATRFASRNATGAVAGPSIGIFEDLSQIAAALAKGDLNQGSANALIRQIPGATLPGIRSAIHIGVKPAFHEAVE